MTVNEKKIKIFVSHRIDQISETINNPLYINVRCGAVYDKRKPEEYGNMLGDDTGKNISELREKFCELTVQYWAWKNEDADYYGLCHYRRYLSFSDMVKTDDIYNCAVESTINEKMCKKYNLIADFMTEEINKYDVISIIPYTLKKDKARKIKNIYSSLKQNPSVFPIEAVDLFIDIFKKKYPDYAIDVDEYFEGRVWRGFNCYILKKDYFNEYSSMLFDILFEMNDSLDTSLYNQEQMRVIGYMGEVTFGIYYHHLQRIKKGRLIEKQLIRIENPEKRVRITPAFNENDEVPIVVSSSNEYSPFLGVLICSIVTNANNNANYDIIVLENKISDENKRKIYHIIAGKDNIKIRFIPAKPYLEQREFYTAMHVTEMTYLRLAIIDILSEFSKAIYLDCDIIVNKDIADLFNIDLKDNYFGAVVDTIMASFYGINDQKQINYNKKELGITSPKCYFNAGVLLINLSKIREIYTGSKLLDIASQKDWKWFDQDVLNKISRGKVLFLNPKWNVMVQRHIAERDLSEFYAPINIYKTYKKCLTDPWIIHYAGHFIPCYVPDVDCAEYFWKYAKKTEFYHLILFLMIQASKSVIPKLSFARKVADKLLPKGSRRREALKKVIPRDSPQWIFLKKLYHLIAVD
jgi:lipopolysaccharide biosynthesis glycosyltransferase